MQGAPGKNAEELIPYAEPGDTLEAQRSASELSRLAESLPALLQQEIGLQEERQRQAHHTVPPECLLDNDDVVNAGSLESVPKK